ncbi:unnamed protein product [Nesidiocoris tenuis]|uniref:Reverse transcriptase domain-containing protein n=1 Tax=Nesidiocoris tenuis TaxID=355587 RepID=A0A6H5HDP9_9HEMI|nr:unnamed protein product [Nesidiocoris tenuis]
MENHASPSFGIDQTSNQVMGEDNDEFEVPCMKKRGKWTWPDEKDKLWFKPKSIRSRIRAPQVFQNLEANVITKFRVVFDSSMVTKDGPSLNQVLCKGPKLQAELLDILLRFRMYQIVLVTDIRQMYRNIRMSIQSQPFQKILWRSSPEEPVRDYQLTTVTYRVSASPFLAIRTLHQLVQDEGQAYPTASEAIMRDIYMDDIIKAVPIVTRPVAAWERTKASYAQDAISHAYKKVDAI